jgi:hypothetical protein
MKKGKDFNVPEGIIAHLTRECGGNVHDHHVADITSGSFEKEIYGYLITNLSRLRKLQLI